MEVKRKFECELSGNKFSSYFYGKLPTRLIFWLRHDVLPSGDSQECCQIFKSPPQTLEAKFAYASIHV